MEEYMKKVKYVFLKKITYMCIEKASNSCRKTEKRPPSKFIFFILFPTGNKQPLDQTYRRKAVDQPNEETINKRCY